MARVMGQMPQIVADAFASSDDDDDDGDDDEDAPRRGEAPLLHAHSHQLSVQCRTVRRRLREYLQEWRRSLAARARLCVVGVRQSVSQSWLQWSCP